MDLVPILALVATPDLGGPLMGCMPTAMESSGMVKSIGDS